MHHASLSRPYILFRLGSQAWGVRLIQFCWHANHMLMIFVCKQCFERPKTRKWFILDNCVVFIFISVVSKTAHYVMYMYVFILTINAIRLFVFDLTMGHNGLAICVHVWLFLLWINFLLLHCLLPFSYPLPFSSSSSSSRVCYAIFMEEGNFTFEYNYMYVDLRVRFELSLNIYLIPSYK